MVRFQRMKHLTPISSIALAASGCSAGLDKLEEPVLVGQAVAGAVLLRIEAANEECPAVSGVGATMNGTPLHEDSLGGLGGGLLGGCSSIQWSGTTPATPDATFVVTDGKLTWTMRVPGYFAARSLTVGAPGQRIHPGDHVTASVVPDTDRFDTAPGTSVTFQGDDGKTSFVLKGSGDITVEGASLQFTVPPVCTIPSAGAPGTLKASPGITLAAVTECVGPTACKATLDADYAARVTLLP